MAADARLVKETDAATVRGWLERGEAQLFDVREPDERAKERIPGTHAAPLSRFDPAAVVAQSSSRIVTHCKGGVRSLEAAGRIAAATGREAYSLRGGIDAWKAQGLPVEAGGAKMPISNMRQVQLVVGTVVALSSSLALVVSPWFAALAGLMGLGLMFAGATGVCGMGLALARMPWNRAFRTSDKRA